MWGLWRKKLIIHSLQKALQLRDATISFLIKKVQDLEEECEALHRDKTLLKEDKKRYREALRPFICDRIPCFEDCDHNGICSFFHSRL